MRLYGPQKKLLLAKLRCSIKEYLPSAGEAIKQLGVARPAGSCLSSCAAILTGIESLKTSAPLLCYQTMETMDCTGTFPGISLREKEEAEPRSRAEKVVTSERPHSPDNLSDHLAGARSQGQ